MDRVNKNLYVVVMMYRRKQECITIKIYIVLIEKPLLNANVRASKPLTMYQNDYSTDVRMAA